jgi:CheY-like chemotaxis protein
MGNVATADVLVIEDSLEDAELTIYALRGTCTHITVDTVTRGEDALCYLLRSGSYAQRDARSPQLVLLDLEMPGIDAAQALHRLRSDDDTATIPVVVLTTQNDPRVINACYRHGANSVVCKASSLKDYFSQIQQLAKYWLQVNVTGSESEDALHALDDARAPQPRVARISHPSHL